MGIAPWCGVEAVSTAYAAGPASDARTASAAPPPSSRGAERPGAISATAATPAATIAHRSHGTKSGVRSSSAYDHRAVTATVPASTAVPAGRRHSTPVPRPTSAPIAGASATV